MPPSLSAAELRTYLDTLFGLTEALNLDVLREMDLEGDAADFDRAGWNEYLDAALPTSLLVPGVAPVYKDGPIGWRQYHRQNRGSAAAMNFRTDGVTREAKEYQSALAGWYERLIAAGGQPSNPTPEKPGVEEMPGPIAPVDLSDITDPIKDVAVAPFRLLGLTPRTLAIGAGVAGVAAALALLAPYARLLRKDPAT